MIRKECVGVLERVRGIFIVEKMVESWIRWFGYVWIRLGKESRLERALSNL